MQDPQTSLDFNRTVRYWGWIRSCKCRVYSSTQKQLILSLKFWKVTRVFVGFQLSVAVIMFFLLACSSNKSVQSMRILNDIMDTNCSETKSYSKTDVKHEDLVTSFSNFKETLEKFKKTLQKIYLDIGIKSQ